MALSKAIQGARYTAQLITWQGQNLTGATLTGRISDQADGSTATVSGVLSIINPATGVFSWAYGASDVAAAGLYEVQFVASYGTPPNDLNDKTLPAEWEVIVAF